MINTIKETSILQATTSKGKTKYWIGRAITDGNNFFLQTEYWQDGGQHSFSTPSKIIGKNIGKANETTDEQQVIFDLGSKESKQRDKGYTEDGVKSIAETNSRPLPMLAHTYNGPNSKKPTNIKWPVIVQPKFDGVRCLYHPERGFWSRQGKPFLDKTTGFSSDDVAHLRPDTTYGYILDGELMLDPEASVEFQQSIRAVKKHRPELTPHLRYFVYDILDETGDLDQSERTYELKRMNMPSGVSVVEGVSIIDHDKLVEQHAQYLSDGYEGTIIRATDGYYKVGHRSRDLLKYKDFDDNEFEIIDVVDGNGKDEGCAILVCLTECSKKFKARMRGKLEYRKRVFEDRDHIIGKRATIKFQGRSEDNIPRFTTGQCIRDYE